jgi:hypothetical protein
MNRALSDATRLERSADVLAASLDEGLVLTDVQTGRYYELNVTGTRVWELLANVITPAGILGALAPPHHPLSAEHRQQVLDYLENLIELGLVRRTS